MASLHIFHIFHIFHIYRVCAVCVYEWANGPHKGYTIRCFISFVCFIVAVVDIAMYDERYDVCRVYRASCTCVLFEPCMWGGHLGALGCGDSVGKVLPFSEPGGANYTAFSIRVAEADWHTLPRVLGSYDDATVCRMQQAAYLACDRHFGSFKAQANTLVQILDRRG